MLGCKLHVIVGVTTAPHWKLLLFQAENEKQTVIEKPHMAQTGNQSYSSHISECRTCCLSHRKYQNVLRFVCSYQFHLSHPDKELLEREDRRESQQEILRRIAKDLPIYTRTMSGGGHFSLRSAHPNCAKDITVSRPSL